MNFDNSANLYNFYTSLDLVCKPKAVTAKIAMGAFLGIFIGVIFIPRLGDIFGRKPLFLGALWLSLPILLLMIISRRVLLVMIGAFVIGFCIIGRMSCGFVLLMESVERKHAAKVGSVIMVAEGMV